MTASNENYTISYETLDNLLSFSDELSKYGENWENGNICHILSGGDPKIDYTGLNYVCSECIRSSPEDCTKLLLDSIISRNNQ
jgi:hypothetical protein